MSLVQQTTWARGRRRAFKPASVQGRIAAHVVRAYDGCQLDLVADDLPVMQQTHWFRKQ